VHDFADYVLPIAWVPERRRRWSAAAVAVAVAVLVPQSACATRTKGLGVGEDVEFCTAARLIEQIREPRPESRREVLDYATTFVNLANRVDERREIEATEVLKARTPRLRASPEALGDLRIAREAVTRLRNRVRVLDGDGPAVVAAVNDFGDDPAFLSADERLTKYRSDTCLS